MPIKPRISVVLPTHNRQTLLTEAVSSVCAQTFADWELIVVDDASQPPVEIPSSAAYVDKVRCVRHAHSQGGSAAKNTGIAEGSGEVFAFIDDDDLYDPRYLERALDVLDRHPEIDVLFMGVAWFGSAAAWGETAHGQSTARLLADAQPDPLEPNVSVFGDRLLGALLKRVPMPFQRPVVRRAALERIGYYRSDCLLWDCEWALHASLAAKCAYLDEPLYRQRLDGQGYSSRRDRELDHLRSGCDISYRLFTTPPFAVSAQARELLRVAASDAEVSLARFFVGRRQYRQALSSWWKSQRLRPGLHGVRILLGLVRRAFKN